MTRRIDELGRLVIPKEIRKNLKIRDNDQVEISIIDNKIVLTKYDNLNKDRTISILLNCIRKTIDKNILLTTRNEIIDYSLNNKSKLEKKELSKEIMNIIENRIDMVNFSNNNYLYNIYPLIVNSDIYGSLIIYDLNALNDFDLEVIKFSKMFLENYLE